MRFLIERLLRLHEEKKKEIEELIWQKTREMDRLLREKELQDERLKNYTNGLDGEAERFLKALNGVEDIRFFTERVHRTIKKHKGMMKTIDEESAELEKGIKDLKTRLRDISVRLKALELHRNRLRIEEERIRNKKEEQQVGDIVSFKRRSGRGEPGKT